MEIKIEIEPISRDEILDAIVRAIVGRDAEYNGDRLRAGIESRLDDMLESHIRRVFDDAITDRIGDMVDRVLSEGWVVTDNYGNATGGSTDLRGRISQILTKADRPDYNRPAVTIAEKIAKETIEAELRKGFEQDIAAARAAFRKQVDEVVVAKLAETLKSALGLR